MAEKNKPYTVIVTETAREMLITHARFLANVSTSAANRLIETFVEMTNSLADRPERNPWLEHDAIQFQKYRKLLFEKHYLVIYELQDSIVYVTVVVDCRQDYGWLL